MFNMSLIHLPVVIAPAAGLGVRPVWSVRDFGSSAVVFRAQLPGEQK
jgi:hypothetical protein